MGETGASIEEISYREKGIGKKMPDRREIGPP